MINGVLMSKQKTAFHIGNISISGQLIAFGLLLALFFSGCTTLSSQFISGTGCPSGNSTVCGADGVTYLDACLAQTAGTNVSYNGTCASCRDSDGGNNVLDAGHVLAGGSAYNDSCINSSTLKEYFCTGAGAVSHADVRCSSGYTCTGGACVVSPCTDSDNGETAGIKGTTAASGSSKTDSCVSDTMVSEYYCSNGEVLSKGIDCGSGEHCVDGACAAYQCTDSDNGKNANTSGTATLGPTENQDTCADNSTVTEYYCDSNRIASQNITCGTGKTCKSGACKEITCEDSDGGIEKNVFGIASLGATADADTCYSNSTVIEYYCSDGAIKHALMECSGEDVCLNGTCTAPKCTKKEKNLDPDDKTWYSIKTASSIKLYDGEMAEIMTSKHKYLVEASGISEDEVTLVLYDNDSDSLCDADFAEDDTDDDFCGEDVGIEVGTIENGTYAVVKGDMAFLEIISQDGSKTAYNGTGCPPDVYDLDSETDTFYPRLDSSTEGKYIMLAGVSIKIKDVNMDDEILTLTIDDNSEKISDGDSVEIEGVDYDISITFGDYGITEITLERG
jgi:hypothetical protein